MTRSHRPFALASFSFILVVSSLIVCTLAAQAASPGVRNDANRITAATNITLRATPAPDASAVAQLPLGTELIDAAPRASTRPGFEFVLPTIAKAGFCRTHPRSTRSGDGRRSTASSRSASVAGVTASQLPQS